MSSDKSLILTVFRALLRTSKKLEICSKSNPSGEICLRRPIEMEPPIFSLYKKASDCHGGIIDAVFPSFSKTLLRDQSPFLRPGELAQLIHRGFAENGNISADQGTHLDEALDVLRILEDQRKMTQSSSITITEGVKISVSSQYGMAHSGHHIWGYRCQVENLRDTAIQILGRHWIVLDKDGHVSSEVTRGSPGLVGQKPKIPPGGLFQVDSVFKITFMVHREPLTIKSVMAQSGFRLYYSHTSLESDQGSMQGSFQYVNLDNNTDSDSQSSRIEDARIKPFRLLSMGVNTEAANF